MFDPAQIAIFLGIANGVFLLLKPIARLHNRIDTAEADITRLEADIVRIETQLPGTRRGLT